MSGNELWDLLGGGKPPGLRSSAVRFSTWTKDGERERERERERDRDTESGTQGETGGMRCRGPVKSVALCFMKRV